MRVLMLVRFGLLNGSGGDRIQIENTASELRKLGVNVDISSGLKQRYSEYDVVHVFQLDWKPETYFYVKDAVDAGVPVVLSPIHHNVAEVKRFDDEYVFDFRRFSKYLFKNQFHRDTFKNIYSSFFDFQKLKPTLYSVFLGLKNMQRASLKKSSYVLVQTELEAKDLKDTYNVNFKWKKIPNGVSANFLDANFHYSNMLGISDYVVCVGRIEPRKNQLNVIKAVEMLRQETRRDIHLVLVGSKHSTKHFEYNMRFEMAIKAKPWIHHLPAVPYQEMPSIYHYAKVGVSASWFETTGLTSLEALFCSANAVASGARAREYLGANASYCDPGDVATIKEAIKKEYFAPRPVIEEAIRKEYTWSTAAEKTLEVYKEVLSL